MNTKLSKSPMVGRGVNLPLALRASVGADGGGGGARPAPPGRTAQPARIPQGAPPPPPQLSAGVGWEAHPNARAMAQMAAAVGAQGIGGDMAFNPQRCIPQYPDSVVDSMGNISCAPDMSNVPPGVDGNTVRYIQNMMNLAKYATAATRLGWLCDSIAYVTPAIGGAPVIAANAALGAISLTPTRSFTMDAFVMASGTSNDPLYFVTSFTYQGTNYVGTGPWISTLYTPTSGCCLCVRVIPIIEKNTTITIAGTNGNVANVFLFGELFGYTLFSGSP